MKKAIIISAVVLAAAIISTVCFGAAVGYQNIERYWDGNPREFFDNVENAVSYGDSDDWSAMENPSNLRETREMELSSPMEGKDTLRIHADAAEVEIMKSADGSFSADVDIYSLSGKYDTERYNLTSTSEYDVYLGCNSAKKPNCAAVLRVAVPDSVKNLVIDVDAGEVDVTGLTLGSLDVKLSAGNVEIHSLTADGIKATVEAGNFETENCNVKNADVNINMGNAELSESFIYTESLKVNVNMGDAEIALPRYPQAFSLSYDASMGNIEIDDDYRDYGIGSKSSSGISQSGTFSRNPQSLPVEEIIKIDVSVSMGNIKID